MANEILFDVKGSVATLTLNRPQMLNAVNEEAGKLLVAYLSQAERDPAIRCLLFKGAGDNFCAGGDVSMFKTMLDRSADERRAHYRTFLAFLHLGLASLARMPKPVVAVVRGAAVGIGLSFTLASDLAIAADNAKFALAYTQIGVSPDGSATFFLPRTVGLKKAKEIALLNERMDAQTALGLGIINRVVPLADLDKAADDLAAKLAAGATGAIGRTKALLNASLHRTLAEQLDAETEFFAESAASADFAEGVGAFMAKRPPTFTGK